MRSKMWLLGVVCLMVMAIAAACSGGTEGTTPGETSGPGTDASGNETVIPEPPKEPPKEKDPVELVFYSQVPDYDEQFAELFGNLIEEKYSHITVTHLPASSHKIADILATGQTIDVLFMSIGQANTLTMHDYQYDISEWIKQKNYDLNRLETSAVDLQRSFADGGMYGLPVFTNTLGLFYNKDIFDRFGVDYPLDGMTWNDLYELARVMSRSDGSDHYNGLAMSSSANIVLNQYSAAYVDPATRKNAFMTEPFRKAFELLTGVANIADNGLTAATWSLGNQQKMFLQEQRAAMFLHFVVYALAQYKDQLNWDIATYPTLPDQPGMGAQTYPTYFYVTQTSKHKEDAFDAIAYMTTDEFQNHLARRAMLPVLQDRVAGMAEFGAEAPYLQGKNLLALLPEKFAPSALTHVDIVSAQTPGHKAFFDAYQSVVLGLKDVNTALREAGEMLDQELASLFAE